MLFDLGAAYGEIAVRSVHTAKWIRTHILIELHQNQ